MNLLLGAIVVVAVAAITWLVARVRPAIPAEADAPLERRRSARNLALTAGMVGVLAGAGFLVARALWPDAAQTVFLVLGLGLTALFSIGAAAVRTQVIKGGVVESIVLNVVWGVGYGIVLPLALTVAIS